MGLGLQCGNVFSILEALYISAIPTCTNGTYSDQVLPSDYE